MSDERLFLDTVFIQALLNKRDQYYVQASTTRREFSGLLYLEAVGIEAAKLLLCPW